MIYKKITLRRGKEESLKRFHPWVFSGAIATADDTIEEGDIVSVFAADGTHIGNGHYQVGSIMVRILAWGDTAIDDDFYAERLAQAWRVRQALGLVRPDNNSYRLVHGEGDFLPGLVIDIYGNTAVIQAHSPGMHFARKSIARALVDLPGANVNNVYYKSETTLPFKAHLDPENQYLIGEFDTDVAMENGLRFHVDWLRGQKTGFFVDQRENRALLERYSAAWTLTILATSATRHLRKMPLTISTKWQPMPTTSSFSTLQHSPSTRAPSRTPSSATGASMPRR